MAIDDLAQYVSTEEQTRAIVESVEKDAKALKPLKERVSDLERDATQKILRVAKSIDNIVGEGTYRADVNIYFKENSNERYKGLGLLEIYFARVTIKNGAIWVGVSYAVGDRDEESVIKISPKKERVELSYRVLHPNSGDKPERLSRWMRDSKKAFELWAKEYAPYEKYSYCPRDIMDFVKIYTTVPEILADAVKKMREEQERGQKAIEGNIGPSGEGTQ